MGNHAERQQAHLVIWTGGDWPLLDFGALDAEVDIAGLAAHASLVNYRKTILTAVQQVDTSLDAYQAQQVRMEKLSTAMVAAERALQLATSRYNRGSDGFSQRCRCRAPTLRSRRTVLGRASGARRAVRAALQELRRRLAELSGSSRHPPAAAGDHCRVSPGLKQLIAVMHHPIRQLIGTVEPEPKGDVFVYKCMDIPMYNPTRRRVCHG